MLSINFCNFKLPNKLVMLFLAIGVSWNIPLAAAAFAAAPTEISVAGTKMYDYSAMVRHQAGVDCGLHALKNAIALYNNLSGLISDRLRDTQLQGESVGQIPTMAGCRAGIGRAVGTLDPESIYQLAAKLDSPFNFALENNRLLVLDNLDNDDLARTREQNNQLATVIEEMRLGEPFVQAFVLGSMGERWASDAGFIQQGEGHWVAAVLERRAVDGPVYLHMANSAGGAAGINFDLALAQKLLSLLSRLDPQELKFRGLNNLFMALGNNMDDANAVVTIVQEIVDEAIFQGVFFLSSFDKEALGSILSTIDNTQLSESNRVLAAKLFKKLISGGPASSSASKAPSKTEARQPAREARAEQLSKEEIHKRPSVAPKATMPSGQEKSADYATRLAQVLRAQRSKTSGMASSRPSASATQIKPPAPVAPKPASTSANQRADYQRRLADVLKAQRAKR